MRVLVPSAPQLEIPLCSVFFFTDFGGQSSRLGDRTDWNVPDTLPQAVLRIVCYSRCAEGSSATTPRYLGSCMACKQKWYTTIASQGILMLTIRYFMILHCCSLSEVTLHGAQQSVDCAHPVIPGKTGHVTTSSAEGCVLLSLH